MLARELMRTEVFTVHEDTPVNDLVDTLIGEHIHGAPVVNDGGELVGVVSQLDVFFGTMTLPLPEDADADAQVGADASDPSGDESPQPNDPTSETEATDRAGDVVLRVREIMTAPAVAVEETTEVRLLCRTMFRLRIHRLPVVSDEGKVTGMISALDLCDAVAEGREF